MLLTKSIKIRMNRGSLGHYNRVMNSKFRVGDEIDDEEINDIKKAESINQGYNFLFIIDKDYRELDALLS